MTWQDEFVERILTYSVEGEMPYIHSSTHQQHHVSIPDDLQQALEDLGHAKADPRSTGVYPSHMIMEAFDVAYVTEADTRERLERALGAECNVTELISIIEDIFGDLDPNPIILGLPNKIPPRQADAISAVLGVLQRYGFSEDEANGLFGMFRDLTPKELATLKGSRDRADFLRKLGRIYPYILKIVQTMEISPDLKSYFIKAITGINSEDAITELPEEYKWLEPLVFYPSGRPITSMQRFGGAPGPLTGHILDSDDPIFPPQTAIGRLIFLKQSAYIPVTRYGAGMSRGLYYDETNQDDGQDDELAEQGSEFCGTFYYYEPGSDVYLHCGNLLLAPNKILACEYLNRIYNKNKKHIKHLLQLKGLQSSLRDFKVGKMLADAKAQQDGLPYKPSGYDFLKYRGDMYAQEDSLDQELCILCGYVGVEVVLLTTMTGASRVVAEVLDVRPRHMSFANLIRREA